MSEDAADRLVARAIESVLEQVPGTIDTSVPDGGAAKLQPWAETAAPVGRNKRPLEELLADLAARVAADPEARAALPRTRHPALAFFDRFGRGGRGQPAPDGEARGDGGRRQRRRRGGGGAQTGEAEIPAIPESAPSADRPSTGRRRSRRGRGGGGGAPVAPGGASGGAGASPPDNAAGSHDRGRPPVRPAAGGRRRRRRRGGGGRPAPG